MTLVEVFELFFMILSCHVGKQIRLEFPLVLDAHFSLNSLSLEPISVDYTFSSRILTYFRRISDVNALSVVF